MDDGGNLIGSSAIMYHDLDGTLNVDHTNTFISSGGMYWNGFVRVNIMITIY